MCSLKSRKEKPFSVTKVKSFEQKLLSGPQSLEQTSFRFLTNQIVAILNGEDDAFVEKFKAKINSLPTILSKELEASVLREAEISFSAKKFESKRHQIFELFFNLENLKQLTLERFLCVGHWSSKVFQQLSDAETSLNIVDLTLSTSDANDEIDERFDRLLKNCPRLETIHLNGSLIDDDCLHSLAKFASSNLKSVKISNNLSELNDEVNVTDEGIMDFVDEISSRSSTLKSFDIGHWQTASLHQGTCYKEFCGRTCAQGQCMNRHNLGTF